MATTRVLVDADRVDLDTTKPLLMKPDGASTTNPVEAKTFPNEEEAKKGASGKPDNWVPKPYGDYLPQEVIVITEPVPTSGAKGPAVFSVHYARVLNTPDLRFLLGGKPLADLHPAHVLAKGEILSNSGTMGSVTIGSVKEAVQLAKAALADPHSTIRRAGFAADTQIYRYRVGQALTQV